MAHRYPPAHVLLVALLLVATLPTIAEEGRTPLFEPTTLAGPDADGQFVVTRDITATSGAVLAINGTGVEDVDVDLNGFTLTGNAASRVIDVNNVRSFVLHNGDVSSPSGAEIAVSVQGALVPESRAVLEDLKVSGGFRCIWLANTRNFAVRRSFLVAPLEDALLVSEFPGVNQTRGLIEDNIVRDVVGTGTGIHVSAESLGVTITGNIVESEYRGIRLNGTDGGIIAGNSVRTGNYGIVVINGVGVSIHDNRVIGDGTGHSGILIDNGTRDSVVTDNVTTGHGGSGIYVAAASGITIERNASNSNGDFGIFLHSSSSDNRFGRNTARNNAGTTACTGTTCGTPDLCDEGTGNLSFGDNLLPGLPPC